MSSNKRPAESGSVAALMGKKQRSDDQAAAHHDASAHQKRQQQRNPFLSRPTNPEEALKIFLVQARAEARRNVPGGMSLPVSKPFCEIEARIGILKSPYGLHEMRVASSGPKRVSFRGKEGVANAFVCTAPDDSSSGGARAAFEGGVTRSHFLHWTNAGLSEASPVSSAFAVKVKQGESETSQLKGQLSEVEYVETVYGGYAQDRRVAFPGDHHVGQKSSSSNATRGKMERKERLSTMDVALPASPYDLRLTLATERIVDPNVPEPPRGWTAKRLKRRRSYSRRDKSFAWQLDVTEVTNTAAGSTVAHGVGYEIEMELNAPMTLKLVNETDEGAVQKLCKQLAQQLWYMLTQINPVSDVLEVDEFLREHPDQAAVKLALSQCGALKRFMDSRKGGGSGGGGTWESAIQENGGMPSQTPPAALSNVNFIGCMPVNFSRHNIEDVQRSEDNGYFLSEKTDGVRYLMVFTGKTAVLVDRSMKGWQPIPRPGGSGGSGSGGDKGDDPMKPVLPLIKPGTVLDGEVVVHRKLRRPIFIVFDVLAMSPTEPVLHLPFEQRLRHIRSASFRTPTANRDMFASSAVSDPKIALPLVRKNFVKRTDLDNLLSHVVEERGTRSYRQGETHYHLTDGIIFQPNLPYVCGTDLNLLKWKYLDTVTIDVEILPPRQNFNRRQQQDGDEDVLRVGVLGEEGTMVDMTRFIRLPPSERRRLEADRAENGAKIAEVGFDPTTGEWYYLTMRPDKVASNHISTVLGTLLELAESLTTEELRYRMSVPAGTRDTYVKDVRGMQKQLLEHQRRRNKAAAASSGGGHSSR